MQGQVYVIYGHTLILDLNKIDAKGPTGSLLNFNHMQNIFTLKIIRDKGFTAGNIRNI